MPRATDIALAFFALLLTAHAAVAEFGALNFVNATGLPENIHVRIDGAPLSRKGYAHGEFSGGLLFPAGRPIRIEANAGACLPLTPLKVTPGIGNPQIVVFHLAAPEADAPATPWLKGRILPHREPSARRSLTGIYLGAHPFVIVRVDGNDTKLCHGAPAAIWNGSGSTLAVAMPDGSAQVSLDEPGHYWSIFCDSHNGMPGHLLVPDPKYEIPVFDPE